MSNGKVNILSAKDLDISCFVGSGKGGQNKQKNATGVMMIHRETGATGRCSDTRSQAQNKKEAFLRMLKHPKFRLWLAKKRWEIANEQTLEEVVDKMMEPQNLRIEFRENDKWVPENKSGAIKC